MADYDRYGRRRDRDEEEPGRIRDTSERIEEVCDRLLKNGLTITLPELNWGGKKLFKSRIIKINI